MPGLDAMLQEPFTVWWNKRRTQKLKPISAEVLFGVDWAHGFGPDVCECPLCPPPMLRLDAEWNF